MLETGGDLLSAVKPELVEQAQSWGTSWDKVLRVSHWLNIEVRGTFIEIGKHRKLKLVEGLTLLNFRRRRL
ncbi:MAG: hypothetical protein ACKESB_02830 [Candidatus Hodgkinia cicadicola]